MPTDDKYDNLSEPHLQNAKLAEHLTMSEWAGRSVIRMERIENVDPQSPDKGWHLEYRE